MFLFANANARSDMYVHLQMYVCVCTCCFNLIFIYLVYIFIGIGCFAFRNMCIHAHLIEEYILVYVYVHMYVYVYIYIYGFVSVCAHIYIHRYREDIQARVCLRVLLSVWMDSDNLDLHIDIMCARSMTVDKFYTDVGIPHFILHSRGNDLVTSLLPPICFWNSITSPRVPLSWLAFEQYHRSVACLHRLGFFHQTFSGLGRESHNPWTHCFHQVGTFCRLCRYFLAEATTSNCMSVVSSSWMIARSWCLSGSILCLGRTKQMKLNVVDVKICRWTR